MGFGQEIKDFLGAAQAGQKLVSSMDDREYKRLRTKHLKTQIDLATDPETLKLNKDLLRARAKKLLQGDVNAPYRQELLRGQKLRNDEYERSLKLPAVGGTPSGLIDKGREVGGRPGPQSDATPAVGGFEQTAMADEPDDDEDDGGFATPVMAAANGGLVKAPFSMMAVHDAVRDGLTYLAKSKGEDQPAPAVPAGPSVQSAAHGGKIQHMAGGGLVDDDELPDDELPDEVAPATAAEATTPEEEDGALPINAHPTAGRLPGMPRVPARVQAQGANAPASAYTVSQSDMAELRKVVDPENKLSEGHRNMKVLTAVYEYQLGLGNVRGAQEAAAGILQNYKRMSQQYAAFANAAVENGEYDDAARLAMKAYDAIPDGRGIKIKNNNGKFSYEMTDEETGKVTSKGVASPRELAAMAMKVAANGFDEFILDAAGQRAAAKGKGAVGDEKPMKMSDRKSASGQIDAVFDEGKANSLKAAIAKGAKGKDGQPLTEDDIPDPPDLAELKSAAFGILSDPRNTRLSAADAARVSVEMAHVDPAEVKDVDTPPPVGFQAKKVDGGYNVAFKGGRSAFVPSGAYDRLTFLRAQKLRAIYGALPTKPDAGPAKPAKPGTSERLAAASDKLAPGGIAGAIDSLSSRIEARNAERKKQERENSKSVGRPGNSSQGLPVVY
jgi:hypothetical protein